jgi:hypothetical protein
MSQLPDLPLIKYDDHPTFNQDGIGWSQEDIEAINKYAALAVAAAVPPGYAVVPIEPTEKMKEAAMVTYIEAKLADWGMWKAMVAAAQEQKT